MHARCFPDQRLLPGDELSEETARRRPAYVRALFEGDALQRLEIIEGGRCSRVVYRDPGEPLADLAERHRLEYPGTPWTVERSVSGTGETGREEILLAPDGRTEATLRRWLDPEGEVTRLEHLDAEGRKIREDRYKYRDGEWVGVEVYDASGRLVDVESFAG